MAKPELIVQALTQHHHAGALLEMLALAEPVSCLFSVAFARTGGLKEIEAAILGLATKPKFFVGIRNDITSFQALHRLLELGAEVYTVDTGSRRPIFHPKLYLTASKKTAQVIIGSANLTHYGLRNNIEISTILKLDLADKDDESFLAHVEKSFADLLISHPEHVQRINTKEDVDKLFLQGRLCDEKVVIGPSATQQAPKSGLVELARMNLVSSVAPAKSGKPGNIAVPTILDKKSQHRKQFVRVWKSKPLTARDLSVPEAASTNLTGSIGFKQDAIEEFDFQTHFRETVFKALKWKPIKKEPLKEEATASFQLVIENVDYGEFLLKVAHDNRTNTKSYLQRNFMTQLHWGIARPSIARRDLIGRSLTLYKKGVKAPSYLIEID